MCLQIRFIAVMGEIHSRAMTCMLSRSNWVGLLVGRPGLDPGTLGLKVGVQSSTVFHFVQ
jgi:hypothetical protein